MANDDFFYDLSNIYQCYKNKSNTFMEVKCGYVVFLKYFRKCSFIFIFILAFLICDIRSEP